MFNLFFIFKILKFWVSGRGLGLRFGSGVGFKVKTIESKKNFLLLNIIKY